jgi:Sodium Bile acid symporter family
LLQIWVSIKASYITKAIQLSFVTLYERVGGEFVLYCKSGLIMGDICLLIPPSPWFQYRPVPLSVGYIAQYALKPLLGLLIAKAFRMPSTFYAGFILTCCVAGAQLSSYASYLSKGDVALSILLTSSSTISSVVVTPLLTGLLIGSVVPVDGVAMAKSILQVSTRFNY